MSFIRQNMKSCRGEKSILFTALQQSCDNNVAELEAKNRLLEHRIRTLEASQSNDVVGDAVEVNLKTQISGGCKCKLLYIDIASVSCTIRGVGSGDQGKGRLTPWLGNFPILTI